MLAPFALERDVMNIDIAPAPTPGHTARVAVPQPHGPFDRFRQRPASTHDAPLGPQITHARPTAERRRGPCPELQGASPHVDFGPRARLAFVQNDSVAWIGRVGPRILPFQRVASHRRQGLGVGERGLARPPRAFHGPLQQGPNLRRQPQRHLHGLRRAPAELRWTLRARRRLLARRLDDPPLQGPHRQRARQIEPGRFVSGSRDPRHLAGARIRQLAGHERALDPRQRPQRPADTDPLAGAVRAELEQALCRVVDVRVAGERAARSVATEQRIARRFHGVREIGEVAAGEPHGRSLGGEQRLERAHELFGGEAVTIVLVGNHANASTTLFFVTRKGGFTGVLRPTPRRAPSLSSKRRSAPAARG
jgi:hypothetical protein